MGMTKWNFRCCPQIHCSRILHFILVWPPTELSKSAKYQQSFIGVLAACPPHSAMLQLLSSQFDNLNLSWMAIARWHGGALMGGWVENGGDGWGWGEGGWLLSADPIFSIMMITEMGKIREAPPSAFITHSVVVDQHDDVDDDDADDELWWWWWWWWFVCNGEVLCEAGGASRPGTDIVNCHHFDEDD